MYLIKLLEPRGARVGGLDDGHRSAMTRHVFPSKGSFHWAKFLATGLVALILVLTSCSQGPFGQNTTTQNTAALAKVAQASELTVFRSPTCGCCGKWVEHMQAFGFQIKDNITEDMEAIAGQYGVPDQLRSCHTAIANSYVIEGHIPAVEVARLLQETPDIAGIAVPGMPVGSPGMESGDYVEPYSVLTFDEAGETAVFSEHS